MFQNTAPLLKSTILPESSTGHFRSTKTCLYGNPKQYWPSHFFIFDTELLAWIYWL